jgi:hypothetical protein
MALQRNVASDGAPLKACSPESAGPWAKSYPDLVSFLCSLAWPGGDSRVTGTVMLMTEHGLWKAWVNDRDATQSAFASADSLPGLLKAVEEGLGGKGMDWRVPREGKRK